jgi:hypothetical protein
VLAVRGKKKRRHFGVIGSQFVRHLVYALIFGRAEELIDCSTLSWQIVPYCCLASLFYEEKRFVLFFI